MTSIIVAATLIRDNVPVYVLKKRDTYSIRCKWNQRASSIEEDQSDDWPGAILEQLSHEQLLHTPGLLQTVLPAVALQLP